MRSEEFDRLFSEHAPAVFSFLLYRTGDRPLAEDLLADTFERALRGRRRFDPRRGTEKAWLYTIALNLLRDHVRRDAVEQRALERVGVAASGTEFEFDAADARDQVVRLVAALPDDEREVVALRYGADLTVPEIARILAMPLTTAEGRLYRALRRMRAQGRP